MKTVSVIATAPLVLLLSGCFLGPALSRVGPDTYMASGGSSFGNTNLADRTCQAQGRMVKISNMIDKDSGGYVVFTCMSPSDPAYNRPAQFQNSPNVIIQDNR
jgi:hypothetical protein